MRLATSWNMAIAITAAAAGCVSLAVEPAVAEPASGQALKVAIIYNIVRFVDFPPAAAQAPLRLCALRNVPEARELARLGGRRAGSRSIQVRNVDANAINHCDVLYIGAAAGVDVASMQYPGMLLIGDGAAFTLNGGTIGLVTMGNQTRFEVSIRQARRDRLTISSQLLRLATRVRE